jgi:hypothetical protein
MKLWETFFRFWQRLSDCVPGERTKSRLMEKPLQKMEQINSILERQKYRGCVNCFEDFSMPLS